MEHPQNVSMCMVLLFSGSPRFSPRILFLSQVKLVAKMLFSLGYVMGIQMYK